MSRNGVANVRAPAVLAGYRCRHSLVCCAAPWRATLIAGEFDRIRDQLAETTGQGLAVAEFAAAVHLQRPPGVVKQPAGDCALLDRPRAICRLQATTGLQGLPVGCRNFPRSVVDTPDGCEAAFSLACPTAAAMVADDPAPFAWAPASWPTDAYPPHRAVGERVLAGRGADWSWAELQALREAWWRLLAQCSDAEALAAAFAGMLTHPLDARPAPLNAAVWSQLGAPWSPPQLRAVTEGLARLPDSGAHHRSHQRQRWSAWSAQLGAQPWIDRANAHARLVVCHAGLAMQWPWVHDELPLGQAFVRCALQSAALVRALGDLADAAHGHRDALIAVAHWARAPAPVGALP